MILSILLLFEESRKSKVIVLNCEFCGCKYCILLRSSTVEVNFSSFLEMRTMLNPIFVKTLQNPRPIPSVAPVTTTQLEASSPQYLLFKSGMGLSHLYTAYSTNITNLQKGYPKMKIVAYKIVLDSLNSSVLASIISILL